MVGRLVFRWIRPWTVGIPALLVYLLTLSRGAYPGPSSAHLAAVANLVPDRLPAHPLWMLLTGWISQLPLLTLPLRLNLFSALCGAAGVGLLGWLMEAWLSGLACDPSGGALQSLPPDSEDGGTDGGGVEVAAAASPASIAHDGHAATASRIGGIVTALALAFSIPFWTVATRLQVETFDLLLLLIALGFLWAHARNPAPRHALVVALLCGLGCIESASFVPLSALIFAVLLANLLRDERRWEGQMGACLGVAVLGALAGLLLLWRIHLQASEGASTLRAVCSGLLRAHVAIFQHAWPTTGWIWLLLLVVAPAAVTLFAARLAFHLRSASLLGLHGVMTAAALLCLFNAPVSPWGLARNSDALPVMAALAFSVVIGYLVAFWRMQAAPPDLSEDELPLDAADEPDETPLPDTADPSDEEAPPDGNPFRAARIKGWIGQILGWTLLACVLAAAPLNHAPANGSQGDFADALARDVLDRLGARRWIISGGMLDNHLRILAHEQQRKLCLVSLADPMRSAGQRRLQAWIDAEPALAGRRMRLYNAAALGAMGFAQEWLADDPLAADRLLVLGAPEVWTLAGFRAVPDGFGFSGTRQPPSLRAPDLVASHRAYWDRVAPLLAPVARAPAGTARFRAALRGQAGLGANNLGVLLEDLGAPDAAYDAYAAARRIDPRNLSALFNQHALAVAGTHADARPDLERPLRVLLAQWRRLPPLPVLARTYGDIRQPAALARHGLVWAEVGQPELARAALTRALALAPTNTSMQGQLALLDLQQGKAAASEQAYRAILTRRPADAAALAGLAAVALTRGRNEEAHNLLEQARRAGVPETALTLPEAALLAATGQVDEALAKLRALTDGGAGGLEAWSLLADLLLRRQHHVEVEQRILPAMIRTAGTGDHVLIHLVRASLLRARQPLDADAVRACLLRAIELRPDLIAIRDDLLQLDFNYGSPAVRERDATDALRVAPDHALANYLLGALLLERDEWLRAEDCFRRSLTTQPSAVAYNDLAETLRRCQQLPAAEQSARAALALDANSYAAWDTLGCILLDAGRSDEAAQAVERSLALCAADPRIHLRLARVRLAQNRPGDARNTLSHPLLKSALLPADLKQEMAELTRALTLQPPEAR